MPIFTPDLVRAIRTESSSAIVQWLGVNRKTVTRYRRALGAPRSTLGTELLWSRLAPKLHKPHRKAGAPHMKRKPKRTLRARRVPQTDAITIGPNFAVEPHYQPLVDELIRRHQAEIEADTKAGRRYGFEIRHDDNCPALVSGGFCNCEVEVNLVEPPGPASN